VSFLKFSPRTVRKGRVNEGWLAYECGEKQCAEGREDVTRT
jgi:hypothetical protein